MKLGKTKLLNKMINDAQPGQIIAAGLATDTPDSLHMTGSGNWLKWVVKVGGAGDWAMYCHWDEHSVEWVAEQGDKVHGVENLENVLYMEDGVLRRMRH